MGQGRSRGRWGRGGVGGGGAGRSRGRWGRGGVGGGGDIIVQHTM